MLANDVRRALRDLAKRPLFSLLVVAILALGLTPSICIFSVLNGVVLSPLPVKDPDSLVELQEQSPKRDWPEVAVSIPDLTDYREQSTVFDAVGAYMDRQVNITEEREPQRLDGQRITANLFSILGVSPMLGRGFTPEEEAPGGEKVVVISYDLWRSRYGSDLTLVGRPIRLDEVPHTVVGVMPAGFVFPTKETQIWLPLALDPAKETRDGRRSIGLARLKHGVSLAQAQSELAIISRRLEERYPESNDGFQALVKPLYDAIYGPQFATTWMTVQGAVFLLLLIASANVVCLLLARATTRERELAVSSALGCSRWRLVTYFLVESTVLAVAGGLLSIALARWGSQLVAALVPSTLPGASQIGLNLSVIVFSLALVALASVLCGLFVGLKMSRPNLAEILKTLVGRGSLVNSRRLESRLVVTEIALTLTLLIVTGLFIGSFWKLQRVERGFDTENRLTVRLTFPPEKRAQWVQSIDTLVQRLRRLPGVVSVGAINELPTGQHINWTGSFTAEGKPQPPKGQEPTASTRIVTAGYFQTIGIPLLSGRDFTSDDRADTAKVVVINKQMADELFPGEDPRGRFLDSSIPVDRLQIVGVVGNVRLSGPREPVRWAVYYPYAQFPWPTVSFVVRSQSDLAHMAPAVRRAIKDVYPTQPIYSLQSMQAAIDRDVSEERALAITLIFFAAAGLLLSTGGVYGILSFSVAKRRKEMGLRMALGARRTDVLRLVLREGLRLCLVGLAIGVVGSLAIGKVISKLLFEMEFFNLWIFIAASAALLMTALVASLVPAMRAVSIDPMLALHSE
ncbi:MAG TPA: ABC transporter permease [Thermoanaerobaculia bacterium]|jgi:putative ABC transport system permease protein